MNQEGSETIQDKEYLEKHLEDFDKEEARTQMELEDVDVSENEYQKDGVIESQIGDTRVTLEYYMSSLPKELKKYHKDQLTYSVSRLTLQNQVAMLDVLDTVDAPPEIFFIPADGNTSSRRYFEQNVIVVGGDLLNPYGIITLLHEIGHTIAGSNGSMVESENLYDARNNIFLRGKIQNESEGRLILENERNAWAFALSKLRPFLVSQNKAEPMLNINLVKSYVHDLCLASYSEVIRRSLLKESDLAEEIELDTSSINKILDPEKAV